MDFTKALIAIKAGCEVRLPEWHPGVSIDASDSRRYLLVARDIMSDDWEIAKFPERMDGEPKSEYLLRRAEALRAVGEIGKADKAACLAEACAKAEAYARRLSGIDKRAGREGPAAVAARLAEATVSAVDLSAALSQKDEDVHCEAPYVAKGRAVSAGEVRDEGQPVVKYGLVIEFDSPEALREAMRCQRVEFSVFGMGPPA